MRCVQRSYITVVHLARDSLIGEAGAPPYCSTSARSAWHHVTNNVVHDPNAPVPSLPSRYVV